VLYPGINLSGYYDSVTNVGTTINMTLTYSAAGLNSTDLANLNFGSGSSLTITFNNSVPTSSVNLNNVSIGTVTIQGSASVSATQYITFQNCNIGTLTVTQGGVLVQNTNIGNLNLYSSYARIESSNITSAATIDQGTIVLANASNFGVLNPNSTVSGTVTVSNTNGATPTTNASFVGCNITTINVGDVSQNLSTCEIVGSYVLGPLTIIIGSVAYVQGSYLVNVTNQSQLYMSGNTLSNLTCNNLSVSIIIACSLTEQLSCVGSATIVFHNSYAFYCSCTSSAGSGINALCSFFVNAPTGSGVVDQSLLTGTVASSSTVTISPPFSDTNYSVLLTSEGNYTSYVTTKTVSSFAITTTSPGCNYCVVRNTSML
jgi:hypothetical protein